MNRLSKLLKILIGERRLIALLAGKRVEMANLYRVYGHTTVTVTVEVEAESESDAYEVAINELTSLTAYSGNGGNDQLIGVDDEPQTVHADEEIVYDDVEFLGKVEANDL